MYEDFEDLGEMELDGLMEDYEDGEFENELEFEDEYEFEDEFEDEYEFEDEFEGEYEFENEFEYEDEYEFEDEFEFEDLEADEFIGKWIKKAGRAIKKVARGPLGKALKGLARTAATVAGGAIGGPAGANIARMISSKVIRESEMEGDFEAIGEDEDFEADFETMGGDMEIYEEMEYLAALASEAESEEEADMFIGAIANLAGPLLSSLMGESDMEYEDEFMYEDESDQFLPALIPLAASVLPKAIPLVKKGISAVGKALSSSRKTRKMIRALPTMAAKTGVSLARQAQARRPVTRNRVAGTMARQTSSTIAKRAQLARAIKRNKQLAKSRVQKKGTAVRVPTRTVGGRPVARRTIRVRPALARRAVRSAVPTRPTATRSQRGMGVRPAARRRTAGRLAATRPMSGYGGRPSYGGIGVGPGYGAMDGGYGDSPGYGPTGSMSGVTYGRRRGRRVIRPRYCVY